MTIANYINGYHPDDPRSTASNVLISMEEAEGVIASNTYTNTLYSDGKLFVIGVTQVELDAAVSKYNHADYVASKQWEQIREKRNQLLRTSDWTQLPDAPLTIQQGIDWATYRQTLRDIPQVWFDPTLVVFPKIP